MQLNCNCSDNFFYILQFVLVMTFYRMKADKDNPPWAIALGWLMSLSVLLWIPIVAIYRLVHSVGSTFKEVSLSYGKDQFI